MKIGVVLESMGLPLRQGLPVAARLGVVGVQVDAVGDLAPGPVDRDRSARAEEPAPHLQPAVTALNCPFRRGLDVPENQQARIDYVRRVMTLAFELGPRVVIVQCPKLPARRGDGAGQTCCARP